MKNEAGLPPMKRAFGTRRGKCALRFTRAKIAWQFVSASWQQSCRFIFEEQMLHFKYKFFFHTVASNRLHTMLRIDLRLVMMSRTSLCACASLIAVIICPIRSQTMSPCFIGHRLWKQLSTVFTALTLFGQPKNPECESVQDFYFFTITFSLFTKLAFRISGNK